MELANLFQQFPYVKDLKSEDDDEEESIRCQKNFVFPESSAVSKEGDDEDEATNSYQDVGGMVQYRGLRKFLNH